MLRDELSNGELPANDAGDALSNRFWNFKISNAGPDLVLIFFILTNVPHLFYEHWKAYP